MSTERHLPKKRPNLTIDAEATNENAASTNGEAVSEKPVEQEEAVKPLETTVATEAPIETITSETVQPSPLPPPKRSSAGSLTGGVIGALLALAGAYGLQAGGILPSPNTGNSALGDRLAALEANIASGTSSEGERMAALSAEIAALKDSVAALSQAAGNSSIADRVTALEQAASMEQPATNGAEMAALASRIATLESESGTGIDTEALTIMRNGLATEINGLKADIASLKSDLTARASDPGLAAAVAATALRAAVDRGGAFAAELENLAAVAPDAPAIQALRSFAGSGVPTRQNLTTEFESAAQAMMAASEPVDPNATIFDKLMESARGLVKVRPVGSIEGDTPAARIARMGEALAKGDDAALATEFAALPASSRDAGAAFMQRFNARAEADKLIAEAVRAASPKAGG